MKGKIMTIEYEVTYPVDWLDTNPTKKRFKTRSDKSISDFELCFLSR